MAKQWNHMRRDALIMYASKDKYAYLYGANGETGSADLVNRLWAQYPDHFKQYVTDKGYTKQQLINHVSGKLCFDCSAFICYISNAPYDMNSTSLKDNFAVSRSPVSGTSGSVLWKSGHVALDIGSGMCIDFACEFVDMRLYQLSQGDFRISGELNFIDYTGTTAY